MTNIIIFLKFQSFFDEVVQWPPRRGGSKDQAKLFPITIQRLMTFFKFIKTSSSEIVPLDA